MFTYSATDPLRSRCSSHPLSLFYYTIHSFIRPATLVHFLQRFTVEALHLALTCSFSVQLGILLQNSCAPPQLASRSVTRTQILCTLVSRVRSGSGSGRRFCLPSRLIVCRHTRCMCVIRYEYSNHITASVCRLQTAAPDCECVCVQVAVVRMRGTERVFAMKILNKWEMLKRAEVRLCLCSLSHSALMPASVTCDCERVLPRPLCHCATVPLALRSAAFGQTALPVPYRLHSTRLTIRG